MRQLFDTHTGKALPQDREVSYNQPLVPEGSDPYTIGDMIDYREYALSECPHGCKLYVHEVTGETVLAHNESYGCRR
jgi:hypothetical protein